MSISIIDFHATPDAGPQTEAIQAAIDSLQGQGGRVVIPAGTWYCGTLWLRSGVELHLEAGAVLKGTNRPEDYPYWDSTVEGKAVSRRVGPRAFVRAYDCEHVSVTGLGMIDGDGGCGGQIEGKYGAEGHPQNLQFVHCKGVKVQDIRLRNSGSWMQVYHACEQVWIDGISVWNHPGHHTNDGMDIDGSSEVKISNCDIDSFDDALVFKSTGPSPCRNILVQNCHMRSNCHGIKFGTESVGGFENIRISNCMVSRSANPSPIPGFPEGRPVITGVAMECVDGGFMRNIHVNGLIANDVFTPVFIKYGERLDRRLDEEEAPRGCIEDISILNVHARSVGEHSCSVTGYPGFPVRRIRLGNLSFQLEGGIQDEAKIMSEVPENSTAYPEVNMFTKKTDLVLPAYGFFLRHVEGIRMEEVDLRMDAEDIRPALWQEDVEGLRTQACTTSGQSW